LSLQILQNLKEPHPKVKVLLDKRRTTQTPKEKSQKVSLILKEINPQQRLLAEVERAPQKRNVTKVKNRH
jgi:hypothetical protein